jgi:hypothetical protein
LVIGYHYNLADSMHLGLVFWNKQSKLPNLTENDAPSAKITKGYSRIGKNPSPFDRIPPNRGLDHNHYLVEVFICHPFKGCWPQVKVWMKHSV